MLNRVLALTFGFACFASAAHAQDYEIKSTQVQSQDGRSLSLKFYGKKTGGGANRAAYKVYWVPASGPRREIANGNGRFEGMADGAENNINVNLPEETGHVEVEVEDATPANNKKRQGVGGPNFGFESKAVEEIAGARAGAANKRLVVKVKNHGPANFAGGGNCKLKVTFRPKAGRRVAAVPDTALPALPKRAIFQKKFDFISADAASYLAEVVCGADNVTNNNTQESNL